MWKITHFLFLVSFSGELGVVVMYWGFLYKNEGEKTDFWYVDNTMAHAMMFVFLWIDNFYNYIKFVWNQLLAVLLVFLVYLVVNITITLLD